MKTAENLTALLKSQEQTLRDAVSFAIETAQKAGATAEVGVTKVSGYRFQPVCKRLKMLNLLMMGH